MSDHSVPILSLVANPLPAAGQPKNKADAKPGLVLRSRVSADGRAVCLVDGERLNELLGELAGLRRFQEGLVNQMHNHAFQLYEFALALLDEYVSRRDEAPGHRRADQAKSKLVVLPFGARLGKPES